MMFSSEWAQFAVLAGAHWLAVASPGPDFLLLVRSALRHGRRHGFGVSLGVALANGFYIALALAGLSLLQASPLLLTVMKWLASFYLAWLGWLFMRSGSRPPALPEDVASTGARRAGFAAGIGAGLLSALLNPKNGMFYFGLLTLMMDAHAGMTRKLLYGGWMAGVVCAWDAMLVWSVAHPQVRRRLGRGLPLIERCAGLLLMLAAAGLALSRI